MRSSPQTALAAILLVPYGCVQPYPHHHRPKARQKHRCLKPLLFGSTTVNVIAAAKRRINGVSTLAQRLQPSFGGKGCEVATRLSAAIGDRADG